MIEQSQFPLDAKVRGLLILHRVHATNIESLALLSRLRDELAREIIEITNAGYSFGFSAEVHVFIALIWASLCADWDKLTDQRRDGGIK
jgi:hypothetical protein